MSKYVNNPWGFYGENHRQRKLIFFKAERRVADKISSFEDRDGSFIALRLLTRNSFYCSKRLAKNSRILFKKSIAKPQSFKKRAAICSSLLSFQIFFEGIGFQDSVCPDDFFFRWRGGILKKVFPMKRLVFRNRKRMIRKDFQAFDIS